MKSAFEQIFIVELRMWPPHSLKLLNGEACYFNTAVEITETTSCIKQVVDYAQDK